MWNSKYPRAFSVGLRLADTGRIEAEGANRFTHRDSVSIARFEQIIADVANQRAAPDERHAKPHAFFFGKRDNFDVKRQAAACKILDQRDGEHHAQNPVERARTRHRVDVRSDVEPARGRNIGIITASQIAGGIHEDAHAGAAHPCAKVLVNRSHRLG